VLYYRRIVGVELIQPAGPVVDHEGHAVRAESEPARVFGHPAGNRSPVGFRIGVLEQGLVEAGAHQGDADHRRREKPEPELHLGAAQHHPGGAGLVGAQLAEAAVLGSNRRRSSQPPEGDCQHGGANAWQA
jgi:hypothetical protein